MPDTVLIVDDEPAHLRMADYVIRQKLRYQTVPLASGTEALDWLFTAKSPVPDLLLLDLVMPGVNALEVIGQVKAWNPQLPVIVVTPYGDHEHLSQAIQVGANDYLSKPIVIDRLALSLQNALKIKRLSTYISKLEHNTAGQIRLGDILSDAALVKHAVAQAEQAAKNAEPVWIEGEQGTGKELFARSIHGAGRGQKPFIVIDCAQLENVSAQEMTSFFEKTLHEAAGGTVFFKEIIQLHSQAQRSLLSVLDSARGEARHICSASGLNQSMEPRLLKHLHGMAITLPPLRERKGDIAQLADYFLMMYALAENRKVYTIAPRALSWLKNQFWPGNIRQLSELMRQAVRQCDDDTLEIDHFRRSKERLQLISTPISRAAERESTSLFLDGQGKLKKLKHIESEAIRFALQHSGGCMTRAAKSLGIGRSTLYRKMSELEETGTSYISRANQTMRPII